MQYLHWGQKKPIWIKSIQTIITHRVHKTRIGFPSSIAIPTLRSQKPIWIEGIQTTIAHRVHKTHIVFFFLKCNIHIGVTKTYLD
jgi:hypothetical protein